MISYVKNVRKNLLMKGVGGRRKNGTYVGCNVHDWSIIGGDADAIDVSLGLKPIIATSHTFT